MIIKECEKNAFVVIGREGSTADGAGFIQRLWADANAHFGEIAHLAQKDSAGNLLGLWGAMSDFSHSFNPWENGFTQGLYLAGVECQADAEPPTGWTKWTIPGYAYIYVENEGPATFQTVLAYLEDNHIPLAGAAHDYSHPLTGKDYLFFPIRRL